MKQGKHQARHKNTKKTLLIIAAVVFSIALILFCIHTALVRPPEIDSSAPTTGTEETQASGTEDDSTPVVPQSNEDRKDYCYTFLIAASDQSSGNSDVIMVLTYDTVNQSIGIVSVPRDTLVDRNFPKINSVYHSGVEALEDVVSDLLGIPIDFYVTVDVDGFAALVDEIGGVDFDIPCGMDWDDPVQDLYIHFEAGLTHLNGADALKVCRFRHNNDGSGYSDTGRTATQQALLKTIAAKVLANPQKIGSYIDIFSNYIETDIPLGNLVWFAESALGLDLENGISTATLPGDGLVSYKGTLCYQLYPDQVLDIVNTYINPYKEDITLNDMNIFQVS